MKNFIDRPLSERIVRPFFRVLLALTFVSCTPVEPTPADLRVVELRQLIEEPRGFDGNHVSVSGYVSLSNERGAIFVSEAGADGYDIALAIRVLPSSRFSSVEAVDGTYARISGVFHAENGDAGPWIGTILLTEASVGHRFRPHRTPEMADVSPDSGRAMFDRMSKESAQLQSEWERGRERSPGADDPSPTPSE